MRTLFLIILLLLISSLPAYAQWEYGGKVIGYYSNYTNDLSVAHIGQGRVVVAWDGPNYIKANLIDSAGYALWGSAGMNVYGGDSNRCDYTALLPDNHGGVYVAWSDWRHTWAQGVAIYGQHLDSLGNKLWAVDGQRLTADSISHGRPKLFSDGHGGMIIVYESNNAQYDIGAQRVDSLGNIMWDSAGISLVSLPGSQQWYPATCQSAEGEFITCWEDTRNEPDWGTDIYMQRFDINGNIYWGTTGLPVVHWVGDQTNLENSYDIVADGQGGAVIVWVDDRTSHYSDNIVLYADRFSSSGQSLWHINGKKLGNEYLNDARECQVFRVDSLNSFLFRWDGYDSSLKFSYLDLEGNFIWPEPVVLDTFYTDTAFLDDDGTIKYVYIYGNPGLVRAGGKCDLSGINYWPNRPFIGTYFYWDHIVSDGFGGIIAVWGSNPPSYIKITRIYANGYVGGFDTLTAVNEAPEPLPDNISLSAYPNPFNSSTILSLNSFSESAIIIYDISGRKICRLMAENGKAVWDASSFPSGVYFAKAEAGGVSKTIKLILLK